MLEYQFVTVVGEHDGDPIYAPVNKQLGWSNRPQLRCASLDAAVNACVFTPQVIRDYKPQVALYSARETCRTGIVMMPETLAPGSEAVLMDKSGKLYQKGKGFNTKSYLKAEHFTSREELQKVLKDMIPMTTEIVIMEYKKQDVLCTSKFVE